MSKAACIVDTTDKDEIEMGIIHTEIREGIDGDGALICHGPSLTSNDPLAKNFLMSQDGTIPYPTVTYALQVSSSFRLQLDGIADQLDGYSLANSIKRRKKRFLGLF